MSNKIQSVKTIKNVPSITKEPCLWKNNPFPPSRNIYAKPLNNINYLLKEKWIYAINKHGEYYNRKLKSDFSKNSYFTFLHSGEESLIVNLITIALSFVQNWYNKWLLCLSMTSFILMIVLSVVFFLLKSKLSKSKSFLIEALQCCIALNYIIQYCSDSLINQYLSIFKYIIAGCLICLGNIAFSKKIVYSSYIYIFSCCCITLTLINKYTFLSGKFAIEFVIGVVIFGIFLRIERFLRIKKILIWNMIDNYRCSAKIINNTSNYPIMKINNKKGIEYLNNAGVWLFKEASHKKSTPEQDNKSNVSGTQGKKDKEKVVKVKEKLVSKGSISHRIKQAKSHNKKCTYNLHDILINEDYFDFNSYNSLTGSQKYFLMSFIPSLIDIDVTKTRFLGYAVANTSNINMLTYRAEIVPYWKEKDKYLLVLYPNIEQQYTKFLSRSLEKLRDSLEYLSFDIGKCCESFVDMFPQAEDSSRDDDDKLDSPNESTEQLQQQEPEQNHQSSFPVPQKGKIPQHPSKTGFKEYGFSTPIRQPKMAAALSTKLKPRSLSEMTDDNDVLDLRKDSVNASPLSLYLDFGYLPYALWFQFQHYWFVFTNTLLSLKYCHLFFLSSFSMKYIDINLDHVFTYLSFFLYIPSQKYNLDIQFNFSGERLLSTRFDYFKSALINLLFFLMNNIKMTEHQQVLVINVETYERKTNIDNSYYYYQYVCDSSRGGSSKNIGTSCFIPNEIFFGEMPKDDVWIKFSVDYTNIELAINLKEALEKSGDLYNLGNLTTVEGKSRTTHFSLFILNFIIRHIFGGSIHLVSENGKQKMNFTLTARKSRKKEQTKDVSGGFGVTPKMQPLMSSSKAQMSQLKKSRAIRKITASRISYLNFIPQAKYDITMKYFDQVLFSVYKIMTPQPYTLYLPNLDPQNKLHSKWSTKNLQQRPGKEEVFTNIPVKGNNTVGKHTKNSTMVPSLPNNENKKGIEVNHKREHSEPIVSHTGSALSEGISVFNKQKEDEVKGHPVLFIGSSMESPQVQKSPVFGREQPKKDFFSLIKCINNNSSPTEQISLQQQHEKLFQEVEIKHTRPKSELNKICAVLKELHDDESKSKSAISGINCDVGLIIEETDSKILVTSKEEDVHENISELNKSILNNNIKDSFSKEYEKEKEFDTDKDKDKEQSNAVVKEGDKVKPTPVIFEEEKQKMSPQIQFQYNASTHDETPSDTKEQYIEKEDNDLNDIYSEVDLMDLDVLLYRSLKEKINIYLKIGHFVFQPSNIVDNTAVQKKRFKEVRQTTSVKIKKAIQALKLIE